MNMTMQTVPKFIFLPHFKSVPSQNGNLSSQVCPFVQGEPFYMQMTFKAEIDLAAFAQGYGFEVERKRTSPATAALMHPTTGKHHFFDVKERGGQAKTFQTT